MIISNSAHELKPNIGSQVVSYLMAHLPEYSFFDVEKVGVGSRVGLIYSLLKLGVGTINLLSFTRLR